MDIVSCEYHTAYSNPELVNQLHAMGIQAAFWTVDTQEMCIRDRGWNEEVVDLKIGGDKSGMTGSHGGGDLRLVEDFVHVLQGEEPSISCTTIKDSINGHLGVFCAERARKESAVITMPDIR